MSTQQDYEIILYLENIMEKHSNTKKNAQENARKFLTDVSSIAYRIGLKPDSPIIFEEKDIKMILGADLDVDEFCKIAVEAGLFIQTNSNLKFTFINAYQRDAHTARFLMEFLTKDYMDRGLIRDQAVEALIKIGIPAIPQLINGIQHHESEVRLASSVALRTIGAPAVPLLEQILGVGNEQVRRAVLEAFLSPESSKRVTKSIIKILLNDDAPLVRVSAAMVLGKGGSHEGVEALIDALNNDAIPMVRNFIKGILNEIEIPIAKRALEKYEINPKPFVDLEKSKDPLKEDKTALPKKPRLFLSYARENKPEVSKIRGLIQDAGMEIWFDSESLLAGQQWESSINRAIDSSDFVIGFISKYSFDGYQLKELEISEKQISEKKKNPNFLLPCILEDEIFQGLPKSIPDFLLKYHIINLAQPENGWTELRISITNAARSMEYFVPVYLRTVSNWYLENSQVNKMLIERNFFDSNINIQGSPPYLVFGNLSSEKDGLLIQDLIANRTWTRDCFVWNTYSFQEKKSNLECYKLRLKLLQAINNQQYGGYSDWRIATIDELMSLMTPNTREGGLYISSLFSDDEYVASCDYFLYNSVSENIQMNWYALYGQGYCQPAPIDSPATIRFVRTGIGDVQLSDD